MGVGKDKRIAKRKAKRSKPKFLGRDPLSQAHKVDLGDDSSNVFIVRHLRSGAKSVPVVVARRSGYRQNPNMLVPALPVRSTETRKAMTDEHTRMIAGRGASSGNLTQQRATARAVDWSSLESADDSPSFQLKGAGLARCHILADSRVAVIVPQVVGRVAASGTGDLVAPPEAVASFIAAMTGPGPGRDLAASHFVNAVNQARQGKASSFSARVVINALSLGQNNLYFGDATRNGDVSNGFDMLFDEQGRPEARAIAIRDAVIVLAQQRLLDFHMALNAITPTRDRRTGLAMTSSERGSYDASEQLDWNASSSSSSGGGAKESFN